MIFKSKKNKAKKQSKSSPASDKSQNNDAQASETKAASNDKNTSKQTNEKGKQRKKRGSFCKKLIYLILGVGILCFLLLLFSLWLYSRVLNDKYHIDSAMKGSLWELPSRVYARPAEFYVGAEIKLKDLETELKYLNYQPNRAVDKPKTYWRKGNQILINKSAFSFWNGKEPQQLIRMTVQKGKVTDLMDMERVEPIAITRLEPLLIGSVYPKHGQDRVLINLEETPSILVDTLLATEDRRFYEHMGIDPRGLARALFQAIKTRKVRQGASTLTQQFVKNHFLNRKRSISRKVKEAIIAVMLERRYSKKEILEGYLNEIFLGQDGGRAIHGFGLASQFYFGKPLKDLGVHQIASLIALVREPVRANPYRHEQYAKKRRNLILTVMAKQKLITEQDAELAKSLPLDILAKKERIKKDRYYSFLQLVHHRLEKEYDKNALASGLNIFTTLNPIIQDTAEKAVSDGLNTIEKRHRIKKNFLQAASVIVNSATAEIVAVVGDRDNRRHGYNRAFQAKRQPGSLLKPVLYLSALEYPGRYNLATFIDDSPLVYKKNGEVWKPKNYSKRNKGHVMLIDGLVKSYNIPTARIGLDIGIDDFIGRLEDLGGPKGLPKYPSIVLGSVAMSPLEVAEIYESLANGGYRMPLRVITSITDAYDRPLSRYPLNSVQVISEQPYYLIIKAMQDVVRRGTAVRLKQKISRRLNIAGKTGTTDDYRDSWFAGFSGNYLNVVWVGNDDNKKTGLSGSKGAMRVWMDIMKDLPLKPLSVRRPEGVVNFDIDAYTGKVLPKHCPRTGKVIRLPFIIGSEPMNNGYLPSECPSSINLESFEESVPIDYTIPY